MKEAGCFFYFLPATCYGKNDKQFQFKQEISATGSPEVRIFGTGTRNQSEICLDWIWYITRENFMGISKL